MNAAPPKTTDNQTKADRANQDLAALLRARNSLIWISTVEEARVERVLATIGLEQQYSVYVWDCWRGLWAYKRTDEQLRQIPIREGMRDPTELLNYVQTEPQRAIFILEDYHAWLADPITTRGVRSIARRLQSLPRDEARTMIVLAPSKEIRPELTGSATLIEYPLPERAEIARTYDEVVSALAQRVRDSNGTRDACIDAALGLSTEEAGNAYARSAVLHAEIRPAEVAADKKRVITATAGVEWTDPHPLGLDAVGGLENLKNWLTTRRNALTKAARDYGLPAPKGVLLVGVPGCGKSYTAKAIGTAWNIPLLRLDLGGLRSKWVGESEGNIRTALARAETVAPCVLWIDEIEKAISANATQQGDGGVSADALGTVLAWMQDHVGTVFVVATANDVSALPPELLRKGRLDEIFFVDLPGPQDRAAVLAAALREHGRSPDAFGLDDVAAATRGFTGVELASLVSDALYAAYADNAREITTQDLIDAAQRVTPLAKTAAEKINTIRQWARGRATPASDDTDAETSGARELEVMTKWEA